MKTFFRLLLVACSVLLTFTPLVAQWVQTNGPDSLEVKCLILSGGNLYAGTSGGGVFLSTDNGASWSPANIGLTDTNVESLLAASNGLGHTYLYAGTGNFFESAGVFISTNGGASWASSGLTNQFILSLAIAGSYLFAGTETMGVDDAMFLSTDNGASWKTADSGLAADQVNCMLVDSTNLFAGTTGGIFLSTNNGTSWRAVDSGLTQPMIFSLAMNGSNLFAGAYYGGVFLSINNGTTWRSVNSGMGDAYVFSLLVSDSNIFAGTHDSGVFLSTNNGTSWTAVNRGLTGTNVYTLAVSGTYLFAGTDDGIWRRPLSEMITGVRENGSELPEHFALFQNYPNPLNPTTTLRYQLPMDSKVSLRVYNVLGQAVATLADQVQQAGYKSADWNAGSVASGVYFYRLEATSVADPSKTFQQVRKMILMK